MNKEINNPHDKAYRKLLKNKKLFLQLLQNFVAEDWVKNIKLEDLEEEKSKFVLNDFAEQESDILYSVTLKKSVDGEVIEQKVYFYLLLELQSRNDFSMAIRIFSYIWQIWRDYYE